jgi:hypothetical protein
MEYLDRMSTNPTQQVLLSLKTVAEQYLAYNFQSYLFDSDYLNYDWAGDNDPDEIPDDKLPPATISADMMRWVIFGITTAVFLFTTFTNSSTKTYRKM